jgi:hypothetical protein
MICRILAAILCMFAAAWLAFSTHQLEQQCVFHFTVPAGWWESHFGDAATVKTNESSATLADSFPSFINRERNTILVPLEFDPQESNYLAVLGQGSLHAGVVTVLDREPDQLIDWIKKSGQAAQSDYTWKFLCRNILLITLLAFAYGSVVIKLGPEAALEALLHRK